MSARGIARGSAPVFGACRVVDGVGIVISLADRGRRSGRPAPRARRATFWFDLADPGTYLAAERVERLPAAVRWRPAADRALARTRPEEAAARAAALGMPLVWPERLGPVPRAMRAALHACEQGRGAAFVLAASRLAFCGGFDLDDPEVLAEAAAAAGVGLDGAFRAAAEGVRDAEIDAAGAFLVDHGAEALPVLRVGRVLYAGEGRLAEGAAALRGGHPGDGIAG